MNSSSVNGLRMAPSETAAERSPKSTLPERNAIAISG